MENVIAWKWSIGGIDANGNTWETKSMFLAYDTTPFDSVMESIRADSFNMLTNGMAVYGNPGVGCTGPYKIHSISVVRVLDC